MTDARKPFTTVLNIMECAEGAKGGSWTIYNIKATDRNGLLVNDKLAAFEELPLGQAEYRLKPYVKDGQFKNWTVERPDGQRSRQGGGEPLVARVKFLEDQVEFLIGKVNALEGAVQTHDRVIATGAVQAPTGGETSRFGADDDIPF